MARAVAFVTLLAMGAPLVPLSTGGAMTHDCCPLAGGRCARAVAITCCEAGEPVSTTPALTSARTVVKAPESLAVPASGATIVAPASRLDGLVDSLLVHATPPRQRLARLSILLI